MSINHCEGCKNCCVKMGLFLPQTEYLQHFGECEGVSARQVGKIFVVSSQEGQGCPYLGNEGCGIYTERPIDCRIYPYIMSHVIERGETVKIVFHTRSDCPNRDSLYRVVPESQVRDLIVSFGKKIYGESKTIVAHKEGGALSQLLNRCEARTFRSVNKYASILSNAIRTRLASRLCFTTSFVSTWWIELDLELFELLLTF